MLCSDKTALNCTVIRTTYTKILLPLFVPYLCHLSVSKMLAPVLNVPFSSQAQGFCILGEGLQGQKHIRLILSD